MPRSARDSDEDVETRTGRKTRTGSGVPESPVRRSTRNKQSTKQNDSSPDLSVTETSSTQTSRSYRKRAGTIDSNSLEAQRRLRSNRNTTDMNETKDSEESVEVQPKKITRRSIAAMNASETPKANTRTRRLTRAGSETKSTPTGRVTRKTRASSMDPESTIELTLKEKYDIEEIGTPSRTKRRASILPTNAPVIEEEEKQVCLINLKETLMEEDESATRKSLTGAKISDEVQESPEKKSNEENVTKAEEKECSVEGPIDHSPKNDHMEVSENIINEEPRNEAKSSISDQSNIQGKDRDSTTNIEVTLTKDTVHNISTDISHNIVNLSNEAESKDETTLHVPLEEGELNTSNKENECLNISNTISNNKQTKNEGISNVSIEEGEINTSNKENECSNVDNSMSEQNKNISNIKKLNPEDSITVLDASTKEDNNVQWKDNKKLGNFCLKECSVSLINSDKAILSFNANNEIQDNLNKENISASSLNTKEASSTAEVDSNDTQISNDKISDIHTVSHQILNEGDTIPKEQSKLDEISNNPKQDKTIEEEKIDLETTNQNISNTKEKEMHCIDEIEHKVNVSLNSSITLNVSVNPKENLLDTSVKEDKCIKVVEITEISSIINDNNESISKDSCIKQGDISCANENQDDMSTSLNVSVNPKENLLDTSVKEDKSIKIVEITEISSIINDNNESISKDSCIKQGDISCANENQDNMSTSTQNSSTVALQVTDDSISEPASNAEQSELHSSECLIGLQSDKSSNCILETNDSSTVAESHDVPEEDLPDDKGMKISSSIETPKTSKTESITELNKSKTGEEAKKNDIQNVDEGDDMSSTGMFQDISADEWKQKHLTVNVENDTNSVHSTSTVKLENDSETECDLVLVDKKAWLAAESLKAAQDKESFEYDSDDTVVLKSKMDYLKDKVNMKDEKRSSFKDDGDHDSSKLSLKEDQTKTNKKTESLQNKLRKDKSLNKTEGKPGNSSINDLADSFDKQLEEEEELILPPKEAKDPNKSEDKLAKLASDKKQKKNRSLNSSLNKKNKLKQKSPKYNRLHISSSTSSISSTASTSSTENKIKITSSGKKRSNKNYSTMVHIGSDSDSSHESTDSSDNDTGNRSLRIPRFLFKNKDCEESDESNQDGSEKASIDSDINAEYNLDGKTIGKFSDDDIPGDECRASESESSDPDDNGSDLADFVVDDDEVEEEEEEGDEDEGENEEEEQEQEEVEGEDQKMKDEKVIEDESEEKQVKGKNILSTEKNNKDTSNKSLNVSNNKNDKKKYQKLKASSEIYSGESSEDEMLPDSKVNTSKQLDTTFTEKKKKKKEKLNESKEINEEAQKENFNESEMKFKRKVKAANNSLICSTPKADVHQHEQYKHNISSERKKRKYMEKTSINNESEKSWSKDLSTDDSDNNKTTLNMSANVKKRHSMEKNISAGSLELIKDTNLPKSLLSKKTHLNKTLSPSSETPTVKYLRKQKLNESAPFIKLEESKTASGNTSLSDKKKGIAKQDEPSIVITEKTVDTLQLDSSLLAKRKASTEVTDSDDQTELRHKKVISKTGQVSEVDDKVQLQVEKENVDNGKKKRKKRNKKKVNTNTEFIEERIESEDKAIETVSSTESKKNKRNKKKKGNVENLDKNDEKSSNVIETSSKYVEVVDIPKKKKKNVTADIAPVQVKEQLKKLSQQNIVKGTSPNAKLSYNAAGNAEFLKSKYEALVAAKHAADSIKANKDVKKKRTEHFEKMQQVKEVGKSKIDPIIIPSTRGIKRLSLEVIENLTDAPLRPLKKQKILQKSAQESSYIITKSGFIESNVTKVNEDVVPSNSGGTTGFTVVNLKKAKKQLKKIPSVASFRQKMLSRNSRYPVTSYIMYLQKQKVTARDQGFVKQV